MRVRNVPTNIRDWNGGTERYGNSIFIFEIANLCIAHLGHLHHTLTQPHLDEIGRIDVVMAPVDGNLHARSRRHDGGAYGVEGAADHSDAFFRLVHARPLPRSVPQEQWPVEQRGIPSLVVSKTTLPNKPEGSGAAGALGRSTLQTRPIRELANGRLVMKFIIPASG